VRKRCPGPQAASAASEQLLVRGRRERAIGLAREEHAPVAFRHDERRDPRAAEGRRREGGLEPRLERVGRGARRDGHEHGEGE
jgi:hypothetical protein